MTLAEFFDELSKTNKNFKWRVDNWPWDRKCIRAKKRWTMSYDFCPITAVYYNLTNKKIAGWEFHSAGEKIALEYKLILNIMWAADYHEPNNLSVMEIRRKTLEILNSREN